MTDPTTSTIGGADVHPTTNSAAAPAATETKKRFAPKTPVTLNPPKDDAFSLDELKGFDGTSYSLCLTSSGCAVLCFDLVWSSVI